MFRKLLDEGEAGDNVGLLLRGNLELVCWSMSSSNCYFLYFMQVCHEAGKVVRYSHLFKNVSQFVVTHTVKVYHCPDLYLL